MTSTISTIPIRRRADRSAGLAERMGLRLLSWAEHRRTTGPRTIDPSRARRDDSLRRPFC